MATYVVGILKYYNYDATEDALEHIRRCLDSESRRVDRKVRQRLYEEVQCVAWRFNLQYNFGIELHMPERCMWEKGCANETGWPESPDVTQFCSERCRIRFELYEFLERFPLFRVRLH